MKLRISWCAALATCLIVLTVSSARAEKRRDYQMAGEPAQKAQWALDGNVEQASYSSTTAPRGVNGFGITTTLSDRQYQFFGYGEYIYARASFSEALAYIVSDPNDSQGGQEIVEYDFDYDSSYRFGGGINFLDCGGALVFNFARYQSDADYNVTNDTALGVFFGPYEVDANPGEILQGDANVDIKSYDIGFAKTFCLGGPCCFCKPCCDTCCGDTCCDTCTDVCCDPCCGASGCGGGCCSGCGTCCPAWELTWSAGVRFADAGWNRSTAAFDPGANPQAIDREDTQLSFTGAGLRTGLLGRRYIGRNGWFSLFAKGDISVLVGDMDIQTITTDDPAGNPQVASSHRNSARRVIPVTEVEAGAAVNLTNNIQLSAGYFIAAWHDLGMRDEYDFGQFQLSHYDDANILGFDGFFAKAVIGF